MNFTLSAEEINILCLAMPILNKIVSSSGKATTGSVQKKPKTTTQEQEIGFCQYVNRKVWKDIHNMEELDNHPQKCIAKACETVNGIRLCTKHKKNDVALLVQAIQGKETDDDSFIIPEHVQRTNATSDPTNTEETINNMDKEIRRIHEQSKYETYNCRYKTEDCFMLIFEHGTYVMDVLGLCLGKIEDEIVIHTAKMKHKQRSSYDVSKVLVDVTDEELEVLKGADVCLGLSNLKE